MSRTERVGQARVCAKPGSGAHAGAAKPRVTPPVWPRSGPGGSPADGGFVGLVVEQAPVVLEQ
jgi:hypothetical protein